MKLRNLSLKNWMNFQSIKSVTLEDQVFVIGPNASGKSNFLDALRFLRDVARPAGVKPAGGGLQMAVGDRGGLSKLRCVNARKDTEVLLEVVVEDLPCELLWTYRLGFKGEGRANNRFLITREEVLHGESSLLQRPDDPDREDRERLTQTFLEQVNANAKFRKLAHFFSEITYLHLVPQLLKFGDLISGNVLDQDPFGQGFLQRIAAAGEQTRNARLRRIQAALEKVVPQFKELRFRRDEITGSPHIEANFAHWRPAGAWQRESQFSDGTLRLIGLLWALMEGTSLLLLEEPELSLNEEIVSRLPRLIRQIQKHSKNTRQVIVTTHSESLLSDPSIGSEAVVRFEPSQEGTEVALPTEQEEIMLRSGLPVGQVLLPATTPQKIGQLEFGLG
ncbi:MAG: AAA family ATPase [Verrucomicrobia bacterium]|nr:AAA family ATPase [Verrucomicrobiota bacterium]